jgi:hypothetical protein
LGFGIGVKTIVRGELKRDDRGTGVYEAGRLVPLRQQVQRLRQALAKALRTGVDRPLSPQASALARRGPGSRSTAPAPTTPAA